MKKSAASEKREREKQENERPAERQAAGLRKFERLESPPMKPPEHVSRARSIAKARIDCERHASCTGSEARGRAEGETRAERKACVCPLLLLSSVSSTTLPREETSASMLFLSNPSNSGPFPCLFLFLFVPSPTTSSDRRDESRWSTERWAGTRCRGARDSNTKFRHGPPTTSHSGKFDRERARERESENQSSPFLAAISLSIPSPLSLSLTKNSPRSTSCASNRRRRRSAPRP